MDEPVSTIAGPRPAAAASPQSSEPVVGSAEPMPLSGWPPAALPAEPMALSASVPGALRLAVRAWRTALPLAAAGWGVLYVVGLVALQLLPGGENDWSAAGAIMLLAAPAAFTPLLLTHLAHAGRQVNAPARGCTTPHGTAGGPRVGAASLGSMAALRLGVQRAPAMLAGGFSYAGVVAFGTGMVIVPGLLAAMMFGLWWVAAAERGAGLFDAARASSDAFALGWLRISALLGLSGALLLLACVAAPSPYTLAGALVDAALLLTAPILHCAFLTVAWHDACQRDASAAAPSAVPLSRAA